MKYWLLLQTIAFESAGIYLITTQQMDRVLWLSFASLHALACIGYAGFCWLLLPKQYKTQVIAPVAFLFLFNFLLPVIGMIGTAFSLVVALHLPRKQFNTTWTVCEKNELPQSPGEVLAPQFGIGALREILLHSNDTDRRQTAIRAIRHLPRQQAVPLLQLAMKDLTDDVRLLAYASLENIETQINESLSLSKQQYLHAPSASQAFNIAQQYWELCYLGIAEGILRSHYLKQAEQFLHKSNDIEPSASAKLLLGRVMLAQQRADEAVPVLREAMAGGLLLKQVAPYLAEAAYLCGDYETAREYIAYFPSQQGNQLSQIKEYWG